MLKGLRILIVVGMVSLLLGGCVRSQVGIEFTDQTHGKIVGHITLAEQMTRFGQDVAKEWLPSLNRRAKPLDGKARRLSEREIEVSIPFYNGADLQKKFTAFFNPIAPSSRRQLDLPEGELPQFSSELGLRQNNLIFALRNHLSLELDLRSLALISTDESAIVGTGNLLELEFTLATPWGGRAIGPETAVEGESVATREGGKVLVWDLKPGEINRLEAVFWVPSPIGIGAAAIAGLVYVGFWLKYRFLTPSSPQNAGVTAVEEG
ncbi:MAG: DUF3153 domain-containing protein [Limnospira sp.]